MPTFDRRGMSICGLVGFLAGLIVAWVTWEDAPASATPNVPAVVRVQSSTFLIPSADQRNAEESSTAPVVPLLNLEERVPVSEVDLSRTTVEGDKVVQILSENRRLIYSLMPALQKRARTLLDQYQVDYGSVVAIEPHTGRVLARVSSSTAEPGVKDFPERANPPAASVFKVITTAALLESVGLTEDHVTCFHGGRRGIWNQHLVDNPKRDNRCQTLTEALSRSSNVIYGKLAKRHLNREILSHYAHRFGWDRLIPAIVPIEPSRTSFVEDPLEFARAAAGFYHTHLSPMHGATLAAAIANDGVVMAPKYIDRYEVAGKAFYSVQSQPLWRAVRSDTANTLTRMMVPTTEVGTASSYFRKRGPVLKGIRVAAKTGSLSTKTAKGERQHYSWWIGFAPAASPQVALSAMVVSIGDWRVKSSHVAREVLEAYFKEHPVSDESPESLGSAD